MKQCPKCGRQWPDKGRFCPADGTPLQEEARAEPAIAAGGKTCPRCGRTWPAGGRFCPVDGTALGPAGAPTAPPPAAKTCPACGKVWPARGRFCPVDGTPLVGEAGTLDPRRALEEQQAEEARWDAQARKVAEARRVALEQRAARAKPATEPLPEPKPGPEPPLKPGPRADELRTSATVMLELPKDLSTLRPSTAPREAKSKKKFSETQWFLKSVHPEELEEVGTGDDLEAATRQYEGTRPVDTRLREKFSLADTFRHHDPKVDEPRESGDAFLNLDEKKKPGKKKP